MGQSEIAECGLRSAKCQSCRRFFLEEFSECLLILSPSGGSDQPLPPEIGSGWLVIRFLFLNRRKWLGVICDGMVLNPQGTQFPSCQGVKWKVIGFHLAKLSFGKDSVPHFCRKSLPSIDAWKKNASSGKRSQVQKHQSCLTQN